MPPRRAAGVATAVDGATSCGSCGARGPDRAKFEIAARASSGGGAYHAIGLPDCIRMGKQAAETSAGLPPRIDS